jgi:hypothetical protein
MHTATPDRPATRSTLIGLASLALALSPAAAAAAESRGDLSLAPTLAQNEQPSDSDRPFASAADESNTAEAASNLDPFAEGNWVVTAYGSTVLFDEDHGDFYTGHLGAHYYFDDNLSIGLEGVGGYVDPNWTRGGRREVADPGAVGALDLMLRWHFVREPGWSIYMDGGVGAQYASTDFPSDSQFNFRDQLGFGGTLRLNENMHLMGGVRYHHHSNAGTSEQNDGGDWAQPYLGVMVPF